MRGGGLIETPFYYFTSGPVKKLKAPPFNQGLGVLRIKLEALLSLKGRV